MTRLNGELFEAIRQDPFFLKGPIGEIIDVHEFAKKKWELYWKMKM